jgi:hypothetical protein
MMGTQICSVLLLVTSLIGATYAHRGGSNWHSRIRIVGFDSIQTGSREGRVYQGAMIALLTRSGS